MTNGGGGGGGGIDGHNWRGGGGVAGPSPIAGGGGGAEAGAAAALAKGELQQADQHLRDHFTLFLYVPTEQVGVIIGKKGAKIQYIQTATNTRVVMAANASKEWELAWFQVMVKGTASGCYAAAKIIASLVDELDDCVAQFHLPRGKHAAIIGKSGATIRRISADTNVRIFVPSRKEEGGDVQLEGEVSNVMKALALIMTAVYGAGGKKGEHDAGGNGEEAGKGKQQPQQQQQQPKREKQPQPQHQAEADEGGPAEPEGPVVEELLVFPLRELRVLTQGKKGAPMAVISRMTGTIITKEAKPRREAEKETEKEGGASAAEEGAGGADAPAAAAAAVTAAAEQDEEERPVKVHVSGAQARLTAAVAALRAVAGGAPLKEVQDSLRAQGFTGGGGGGGGRGGGGGEKKKGRSGKGKGKGNAAGGGPAVVAASTATNNGPAPAPAPAGAGGSGAGL